MSEARSTEISELEARGIPVNVTGTAAITHTFAPDTPFRLREVRLHLSAAGAAGDFTATVDAIAGAAYDLQLVKQAMTGVQDYVNVLDEPLQFQKGDEIDFAWTNTASATYGLTYIYDTL